MNMLYKSKADMNDTLYLKLYPSSMSMSNISYTIGETEHFFDTFYMTSEISLFLGITGFILIVAGSFFAGRLNKDYFRGTFSNFVGGLWGLAMFLLLGLIFPKLRIMMEYLIGEAVGASDFSLPRRGTFLFWLILIVCAIIIIAIWIHVIQGCRKNPVLVTLAMIPLGILHGASMYIMIGVIFRMILLGIALAVAYVCFGMSNTSSTPITTTQREETIPAQLYDKDNRAYHVTVAGGTVFICDNDGREQALYKSGNHTYQDKDGNEYHNWDLEN